MPQFKRILLSLAAIAAFLVMASPLVRGAGSDGISTLAGGAAGGFFGDGTNAVGALLSAPSDVAPLGGGAYLIADTANNRIRRVDAAGVITTVAGNGLQGFGGDGQLATAAALNGPRGIAVRPDGSFLIADTGNNRIRKVDASGVISSVAGNGATTSEGVGDGGPAIEAFLDHPQGVAVLAGGSFLIADTGDNRIRRVDAGETISTVAGDGSAGAGNDAGPATLAELNAPARVVALAGGGFLIADTANSLIRRVDAGGQIATVAGVRDDGDGVAGFSGDGGDARQALLDAPQGIAVRPDGSFLIADTGNDRIREVRPDGTIDTIAGGGAGGTNGDGGPPTSAQLLAPRAVALDGERVLIADSASNRVRAIGQASVPTGTDTGTGTGTGPDTTPPPVVAPPVLGRRAVATPRAGRVLVRLPGRHRFAMLSAGASIPMGTELDTTHGTVTLSFVTNRAGLTSQATASEGRFVVRQPRAPVEGQLPGELDLSGPLAGCRVRAPRTRAAALASIARTDARPRPRGRRVRVHARGKVRTRGRYGAAVVRGTRWTTVDRCPGDPHPGTFVLVREGLVAVSSFVLHRTVLVPAGHSTLAPASRPAAHRAAARKPSARTHRR